MYNVVKNFRRQLKIPTKHFRGGRMCVLRDCPLAHLQKSILLNTPLVLLFFHVQGICKQMLTAHECNRKSLFLTSADHFIKIRACFIRLSTYRYNGVSLHGGPFTSIDWKFVEFGKKTLAIFETFASLFVALCNWMLMLETLSNAENTKLFFQR